MPKRTVNIYESDLSGDVIPEPEVVRITVERNGEVTESFCSEQELSTGIEDSDLLSALVLHD